MLRLWGYKEAGRRNLGMLQELCMYELLEYAGCRSFFFIFFILFSGGGRIYKRWGSVNCNHPLGFSLFILNSMMSIEMDCIDVIPRRPDMWSEIIMLLCTI